MNRHLKAYLFDVRTALKEYLCVSVADKTLIISQKRLALV